MTRTELAFKRFNEGFRCSQAVLESWATDCELDPVVARKISTSLAGGSALGGECGAVAAAFLVIGSKYGVSRADDMEGFMTTFARVREFANRFKSLHGSLNCVELLGLDVFSEEGLKEFREKNMKQTQCVKYVEDVMNILEQMVPSDLHGK
jgi:C_GCAxxG_C_C family probable redox protein